MMWQVIEALGGRCLGPLDATVTHLVLLEPSGEKYNHVRANPDRRVHLVTPDWVQTSYNTRQRQPEAHYMLHEPAELDLSHMLIYVHELSIPSAIQAALARANARLQPTYSAACTHVVLQYRDEAVFPRAVAAGQQLATLHWFKRLLVDRVITQPTDSVLDFPAPEHPVEGAPNLVRSS